MQRLSGNIEALTRAIDPDAGKPNPDWHSRLSNARGRAFDLIESNNPADHMVAGMLLAFNVGNASL